MDGGTVASRSRWTICALLFAATTINYLDRQILALLKPLLDAELGWSNAQYGLVNAAFQGAYAIGLLAFGVFIDRRGPRLGYTVAIAVWSLAAALHVFAGSPAGFAVARVALGLGEGGNFPAAVTCVAAWFPEDERSLATAIFNAGANVGAIIAPLTIPLVASALGWRWAFVLAAVLGLLWIGLWQRAPESRGAAARPHAAADRQPASSLRLLGLRETWAFIVAKLLTDPVWWFFLIWLPDYFKQARGLDLKASGLRLGGIYAIVTALSLCGGWLPRRLARRGMAVGRAHKLCLLLAALCVLPVYFAAGSGPWTAVLLIGLAGAAHQTWWANLFTSVSDMFPPSAIARVVGLGGMAGAMGGMLFPVATGLVLDHFKSLGQVGRGYDLLFALCAVVYVVAFAVHHLLAPRFAPLPLGRSPGDGGARAPRVLPGREPTGAERLASPAEA